MKGTIEKIWENQRKDGEKYWVLAIDGQRYSVWEESLLAGLNPGDAVDFSYTTSGRYKKITRMARAEELQEKRSREIVRMSCIRSAAELVANSEDSPEKKAELVLKLARQFEQHILGEA